MSLINDVLRDLDKQQAGDRARREVPAGLQQMPAAERRLRLWWWLLALLIFVGVVVFGWMSYQRANEVLPGPPAELGGTLASNELPKVQSPQPVAADPVHENPEPQAGGEESVPLYNQAIPQQSKASVTELQSVRELQSVTDQKSVTDQESVTQQKSVAEQNAVPDAQPKRQAESAAASDPVVQSGAMAQAKPVVQVKTIVEPTPEVQSPDAEKAQVMAVSTAAEKNAEPAPVDLPESTKAPEPVKNIQPSQDPVAVARRTLREAKQLYHSGATRQAEQMLWRLRSTTPEYDPARLQLASWLLSRGGVQECLGLLADVNTSSPAALRQVRAHALIAAGQTRQALALLEEPLPPVADNPELASLKAGLLQQGGDYAQALPLYAQLVEVDPARGDWWAGLGIALDQTGRSQPALRAYRQALSDARLSSSLSSYARQRISELSRFLGAGQQAGG